MRDSDISKHGNTGDHAFDPFDEFKLRQIFSYQNIDGKICINDHENDQVEFKRSFSFGAMDLYSKNIAAFANRDGGYLIFGVEDTTKEVVGISIERFDSIDPARVTQSIRQNLAPEIVWRIGKFRIESFTIGLLYVYPAMQKPIVCLRNTQELSDGAIFYRYTGSSERIRYSELRDLIDQRCMRERISWMRLLERIAQIGPDNIGILNTNTGEVSGNNSSFYIADDLLPKIRFINSGSFVETGGEPVLRLVGDVLPAKVVSHREIVREPIHGKEILIDFLLQKEVEIPIDYLKAICYESTVYYPVYFFIGLSRLKTEEIIAEIDKVDVRAKKTKDALLKRLRTRVDELKKGGSIDAKNDKSRVRAVLLKALKDRTITDTQIIKNLRCFLEVITHLNKEDIGIQEVCSLLLDVVIPNYSNLAPTDAYFLRQAICHLDVLWYK